MAHLAVDYLSAQPLSRRPSAIGRQPAGQPG